MSLNTKIIINDNLIQSFLMAIDNKNREEIKTLYNEKYNVEKDDVILEIYKKG